MQNLENLAAVFSSISHGEPACVAERESLEPSKNLEWFDRWRPVKMAASGVAVATRLLLLATFVSSGQTLGSSSLGRPAQTAHKVISQSVCCESLGPR